MRIAPGCRNQPGAIPRPKKLNEITASEDVSRILAAFDRARHLIIDGLNMTEPYQDAIDLQESAFRAALVERSITQDEVLAERGETLRESTGVVGLVNAY
ncbi:hypothetical protein F5X71_29595 [Nocardia brasiliensis]|uniref:Uncharacterized protein n=1 Tax=Nocardia brasiliensis TaxID=37326 RepID=A0A6G9XYA6_NOCBR|nr:hypothetical protein [Nocardia brasiliensis]QIS05908.1 hypothetical protein F5X71_29595 [Nocardia brasiliensis]